MSNLEFNSPRMHLDRIRCKLELLDLIGNYSIQMGIMGICVKPKRVGICSYVLEHLFGGYNGYGYFILLLVTMRFRIILFYIYLQWSFTGTKCFATFLSTW